METPHFFWNKMPLKKQTTIATTFCILAVLIVLFLFATVGANSMNFSRVQHFAQKWLDRGKQKSLSFFGTSLEPIEQQDPCRTQSDPFRIWPIGDSITEGERGYSSYRYWLWQMLQEANLQVSFVGTKKGVFGGKPDHTEFEQRHNSYFGRLLRDVLPLIRENINHVSFDAALIHLGTNDLGTGRTHRQIIKDFEELIRILRERNPQVSILIAEIIPTATSPEPYKALNAEIRAFAEETTLSSSKIIAVDQFSGFDPFKDTYDGIHPTAEGERKIAKKWFSALHRLLRAEEKTLQQDCPSEDASDRESRN